jgi:hypothetical protein
VPRRAPAKKAAAKPAKPAARAAAAKRAPAKRAPRVAAPVEAPPEEPATEVDAEVDAEVAAGVAAEAAPTAADAPTEVAALPEEPAGAPAAPGAAWRTWPRGGWATPARTALLALAVVVLLGAVAAVTAIIADEPGSSPPITPARFVQFTCTAVGLMFGSTVSVDTGDEGGFSGFFEGWGVGAVPLLLTFAALGALWVLARRSARGEPGEHVRTAAVFAVGVALVSAIGRWPAEVDEEDALRFVTSPWKALFWAFLVAAAVGRLATLRPAVPERWRDWSLATRAATVGVTVGVLLGFVVFVAVSYAGPDDVDVDAGAITRSVPFMGVFALNLGTVALGGLTQGRLRIDPREDGWWPLVSADLPAPFWLALLVPLVAVAAAVLYLRRRVPGPDLPRVAALTAAPAALVWLALALLGPVRVTGPIAGGASFRAAVGAGTWNALLVALWFGAGGWLLGKALGRRV